MFITLFIAKDCPYCDQVKWLLLEKNIPYKEIELCLVKDKKFIMQHSPNGTLPILQERELYFYDARTIMFYIDERFPAPSLMPQYPVLKAKTRLALMRIDRDWYTILEMIMSKDNNADKAKSALIDSFKAIAPIFAETDYFMSEELTLADGALTILLKYLKLYGVSFESESKVQEYATRMFNRDSFLALSNNHQR